MSAPFYSEPALYPYPHMYVAYLIHVFIYSHIYMNHINTIKGVLQRPNQKMQDPGEIFLILTR